MVAAGLAIIAALVASVTPAGNPLRLFVTLPIILVVPGYLLIQVFMVPARSTAARCVHALLGVGVSPALLGLLAMSTALLPGGFRPYTIILAVTLACLVMAGVAAARRSFGASLPASSATGAMDAGVRVPREAPSGDFGRVAP